MVTVSIRKLKQEIDQIKQLTQTTHRGQVMASASVNKSRNKSAEHEWTQLDILAAEIGANWKSGGSATKTISKGRR